MDLLISLDIKLKIRTIIKLDLLYYSKKTLKGANMHLDSFWTISTIPS